MLSFDLDLDPGTEPAPEALQDRRDGLQGPRCPRHRDQDYDVRRDLVCDGGEVSGFIGGLVVDLSPSSRSNQARALTRAGGPS
jgi:hypothetical protein